MAITPLIVTAAMPTSLRSRRPARAREAGVSAVPLASGQAPVVLDTATATLGADDRRRLRDPLTGGLILFARHWSSRRALTELVAEMKSIRPDLLVCVDHEGGRVQRFRSDGFTHLPPMRALGELWMRDPMAAMEAATAAGLVMASELRACGVDLSFAPVLDLDHGPSGVIGDRAFHRDARVVTMLAGAVAHGMLMAGMAHCGKHFPGHGYVAADSHVDIPVDGRTLKAILADDAAPYGWLSTRLSAVMPAHVVYPKVDRRPAGFSARWLGEILRGQLGFTGAVFSDDLSMAGARLIDGQEVSYAEAAVQALAAGCDLVLLCNQSSEGGGADLDALLQGLHGAAADGRWRPDPGAEARRLALLPTSPPLGWDDLMRDARYLRALERLV